MRGKELDTLIEHELQLMLVEGFDKPLFPPRPCIFGSRQKVSLTVV